jgi:hypothetical protein
MKQNLLLLRLAIKLGIMFIGDFYKESKKEIADKTLYPQGNYSSCLERSTDILMNASKRARQYYALAIANHRLCSHGDNFNEEIKVLEVGFSKRDIKISRSFWQG